IIEHGANLAVNIADHKVVAGIEGTVLDEQGGNGSAAAIELSLENHTSGGALGSGLQLSEIGNQADHFQQEIEVGFLFRRDIHKNGLAAPIFRHEAAVGQLLLDPVGHGLRL